jgi:O-antigen/teichoic acid export membrane protein
MSRAAAITAVVSVVVALLVFFGAGLVARAFGAGGSEGRNVFEAAALAVPFVALSQVYLGGTRGLKIMRHTLTIYWAGQPVAWIALMGLLWLAARTVPMSVFAYGSSWILATIAAWYVWKRETRRFPELPARAGDLRELARYGAPRAPAALLAQLLFWTDFFVVSRYVTKAELGVYAASVRVAQALVLFLIAVNYMFSPFVADLHARGQRDRLDGLYKALTRWTVAGSIPILLILLILPGPVLLTFGAKFDTGTTALRILLIGQAVNVATGSVGFILLMVGRTGWDLLVYFGSFVLDLVVAFLLAPHLHTNGAAIAQVITLATSNGVRLFLVWRFVHIQPFNRHYARLAVPAIAGGVIMLGTHLALRHAAWPVDLVASAVVGGLAYVGVLLVAGLTPTERDTLRQVVGLARPRKA